MKYVLDSSVAFKWAVVEADTIKARGLRDDFRKGTHELIAPDIFPIELAHALTRAERQKRIVVSEAKRLLLAVLNTAPQLHPSLSLLSKAGDISSTMRVGIYDCLYVALAEQERCEFVTADDKIVKNLQASYPFILSIASFP